MTEREMSLKAMEARLLDRETTLTRFRTLVGELTEERNRFRERVDEGATALGQARDKAQVKDGLAFLCIYLSYTD